MLHNQKKPYLIKVLSHIMLYPILLLFISFLTQSCMHVQNVDKNKEDTSSKEISLNLNRLNNLGGGLGDSFYSAIESGDYYIAAGNSPSDLSSLTGGTVPVAGHDFIIAKFKKADLSLININNLGGVNNDYFKSIIESEDYYIVIGNSSSDLSSLTGGTAPAGSSDFVIAKFNKSDLSLSNINNLGGASEDYFTSIIESGDYYITAGNSSSDLSSLTGGTAPAGSSDFVIAKFNKSDLSLNNINNLGDTSNDYFKSLIESDDYYIAAGSSLSDLSGFTGGSNTQGANDFVIAKFNKSDLSLVSINNVGGTNQDYFESVIQTGDYYIAAGRSTSNLSSLAGGTDTSGDTDFVIAKFNKSDLSLVNINNLGGSTHDYFESVIESGNYYITAGYSISDLSNLTGGSNTQGVNDFVIAKFNKADLSLVRINNLGGTSWDYFYSIIESDNHYIAAGNSVSNLSSLTGGVNTTGNADFVIVKFGD